MERALPLVAGLFLSCTGGHRLPSMPAADRPPPDTSGAAPLPPSQVHIGIPSWDGSALRPTVSGNIADLDHTTTAPRTVPLRTHAVGTPMTHGHAVRVRRHARGSHTPQRLLALSSEAARQCARVRAEGAQRPVALHGEVSSWGCRTDDRRQTPARVRHDSPPGGARIGASGSPASVSTDILERSNVLMRGERVPEASARSQPSLFRLTGATGNAL